MKSKVVREIPATPFLRDARKLKKNLRVAAYCRVSTEEEEQQSSFEIQVEYYTNKIASHDNWTLAGIFADDGISGVHVKNRTQFLGTAWRSLLRKTFSATVSIQFTPTENSV